MIGAGAYPGDERSTSDVVGPRASLVWDGPLTAPDNVLLHLSGCSGITISDLAFYGPEDENEPFPNVTLIRFDNASGWGSGVCTFRNLTLVGAATGIQMGAGEGEFNAADIMFERITFVRLKTGFVVPHDQGVNYRWNLLVARECPTVMRFERGGNVNLDTAEIDGCGQAVDAEAHWVFDFGIGGPFARCSRLTCVRYTGETRRLIRITGDHRVAVDSLVEAQNFPDPEVQVRMEGGALTFHACSFQTPGLVSWTEGPSSRRSTLRFRDCWFNEPPSASGTLPVANWIDDPVETNCFYSIERCDGEDNIPFEDSKSAW